MVELGYSLASEEHGPKALIRQAPMAEEIGFPFALISDHFYLWLDQQGQAPFVWATLGTIAQATERLKLGTGVTCPLVGTHPAIVALAAAICAVYHSSSPHHAARALMDESGEYARRGPRAERD